jgi:hypothetical protein
MISPPTSVPLLVEYGEYATACTDTYLAATTADGGQVARIYARWNITRADGQGNPAEFVRWLATLLPELVRHPSTDGAPGQCWEGHTANYDTFLNDEIGWSLFVIADLCYVGITHGPYSATAQIYELTIDAESFLYAQTHGQLWCASTPRHGYDSDDTVHWHATHAATTFALDALPRNDEDKPLCPACQAPIREGQLHL